MVERLQKVVTQFYGLDTLAWNIKIDRDTKTTHKPAADDVSRDQSTFNIDGWQDQFVVDRSRDQLRQQQIGLYTNQRFASMDVWVLRHTRAGSNKINCFTVTVKIVKFI